MYNIGIDLGGTNIAMAIVDENGTMIRKDSTPTYRERDYKEIIKDMGALANKLIQAEGLTEEDIHSVGIGSPGTPDTENGLIVYANNLKFKNTPVREEFQKYLNKPVYIENDANAAALGEYESGAGEEYSNLVAITLGTGLGAGIVIDGKIITGSYHGGAELGHTVIQANGEPCSCGRKGCWEAYSSATALIRDAKKAAKANPESLLNKLVDNQLEKINAKIVFDAADNQDKTAQLLVTQYIEYLAIGLVNVINIFQPEVIVLGGGVSAQGDNLIVPLKEKMLDEIYGGKDQFKTQLKVAELGNDAGIIGAAMLYKVYE